MLISTVFSVLSKNQGQRNQYPRGSQNLWQDLMLADFLAMRVSHLNFNPSSYCRGWPLALWGSEGLEIDTYYLLIKMNVLKRAETHSGRFLFIRISVSLCFCWYMICVNHIHMFAFCILSYWFSRTSSSWVLIRPQNGNYKTNSSGCKIWLALPRFKPSKTADMHKGVSALNSKWTCQVSWQP